MACLSTSAPHICMSGLAGHREFSSSASGVPVLKGLTVWWETQTGESAVFAGDLFA